MEKHHKSPFICWLLSEEGKEKECVERKKQEERSFNWIPSNWQQEILRPPIFFSLPNEENPKWLAGSILNCIQWYTYIAHCTHFPLCQFSMYITTFFGKPSTSPKRRPSYIYIYKEFKRQQRQESLLSVSPTPRVSTLWIISIILSTSMSQPRHYHGKSEIWF